jgi:hypothetical protein
MRRADRDNRFAVYGQDGEHDELMEVADQRMYEDKTARKRKAWRRWPRKSNAAVDFDHNRGWRCL